MQRWWPVLLCAVACGEAERGATGPAAVFEAHAPMLEAVRAHLAGPGLFVDGEWQAHFGDAPMFGPAFDLAWWQRTGDAAHLERAKAALEVDLTRVEQAAAQPLSLLTDMEPISMALLGLLEAGQSLDDARYHAAADALVLATLARAGVER